MTTYAAPFRLLSIAILATSLHANVEQSRVLRGDIKVEYRWRTGSYAEAGQDTSRFRLEESARGVQGWLDGVQWAAPYRDWLNREQHGANLLYRAGTPNARAVRCVSDLVPVSRAGQPVTFAIPLSIRLGTEEQLSVALKVQGQGEEIVVLNLYPAREISVLSGSFRAVFHTLRVDEPGGEIPGLGVTGLLQIRVYPLLLNYGGRVTFEFSSNTRHMDKESNLLVGSLWNDLSGTDVRAAWSAAKLTEERLAAVRLAHRARLSAWNERAREISRNLSGAGRVEVSFAAAGRPWDRGEGRVQAYPGNPGLYDQHTEPNHRALGMARTVAAGIGGHFSLFRYQHWQELYVKGHPERLDGKQVNFLRQWLTAANETSDQVMLCLQQSAFESEYKRFTNLGTKPLPAEGVPAIPWSQLKTGYVIALREARRIAPKLRIVQMPYEFDNISDTEFHRDAHYRLYQVVYQAVAELNRGVSPGEQLRVAGLGINNPSIRWSFVESFLSRFAADNDPNKRLDYLTWHTYLFPSPADPNMMRGFNQKLRELLAKHKLPVNLPVIVDEMGLAEATTIEDISSLAGAARKEAALAAFSAALHDNYLREGGNFIPISGAGWHFSLLTYGRQDVLSPYAKGMILRHRLADGWVDSVSSPREDKHGYGLYSFATKDERKAAVLVWTASPTIFLSDALPLRFPQADIVLRDLPEGLRGGPVRVTVQSSDPEQEPARSILESEKCQTLPITRGATERYNIDFTPEEVAQLNLIPAVSSIVMPKNAEIRMKLDVREHGMYLITLERAER